MSVRLLSLSYDSRVVALQVLELVILAALAAVVLFQLYAVLGRRVGRGAEEAARTATVLLRRAQHRRALPTPPPRSARWRRSRRATPASMSATSLPGRKSAYQMIVTAFAKGDREALRPLLSPDGDVAASTTPSPNAKRAGREESVEFLHPPRADFETATLAGDIARASVRFLAEFRSRTKDPDGEACRRPPHRRGLDLRAQSQEPQSELDPDPRRRRGGVMRLTDAGALAALPSPPARRNRRPRDAIRLRASRSSRVPPPEPVRRRPPAVEPTSFPRSPAGARTTTPPPWPPSPRPATRSCASPWVGSYGRRGRAPSRRRLREARGGAADAGRGPPLPRDPLPPRADRGRGPAHRLFHAGLLGAHPARRRFSAPVRPEARRPAAQPHPGDYPDRAAIAARPRRRRHRVDAAGGPVLPADPGLRRRSSSRTAPAPAPCSTAPTARPSSASPPRCGGGPARRPPDQRQRHPRLARRPSRTDRPTR